MAHTRMGKKNPYLNYTVADGVLTIQPTSLGKRELNKRWHTWLRTELLHCKFVRPGGVEHSKKQLTLSLDVDHDPRIIEHVAAAITMVTFLGKRTTNDKKHSVTWSWNGSVAQAQAALGLTRVPRDSWRLHTNGFCISLNTLPGCKDSLRTVARRTERRLLEACRYV